jgi:hypothetical protein
MKRPWWLTSEDEGGAFGLFCLTIAYAAMIGWFLWAGLHGASGIP